MQQLSNWHIFKFSHYLIDTFSNYKKKANKIPKTIIETLATLNLCPSLLSKIIVDEIWNKIPITIAVISV